MFNKEISKHSDILDTFIEVNLLHPENFLIVKETLTRIGISPRDKKQLYQTCHILNVQGRNFIVHFKELFLLDGKESSLDETDIHRRNQIAKLLQDWKLLSIKHPEKYPVQDHFMKLVKIISSNDPDFDNWQLIPKYHIRSKR